MRSEHEIRLDILFAEGIIARCNLRMSDQMKKYEASADDPRKQKSHKKYYLSALKKHEKWCDKSSALNLELSRSKVGSNK